MKTLVPERFRLAAAVLAFCAFAFFSRAQPYVPPASDRADIILDNNWRFIQQDVAGAQATNFDDSSWTNLNLPHTWDIADGQDGPSTVYYQGIGWYRTHYTVSNSYAGREFFLKFDGAFLVSDIYVNGNYLGEHQGGFAAFVFDVTPYLNIGGDNVIAAKINNAVNTNIEPLNADFTFWGGIYRDVHLLVTDPVQISPLDYGSDGVYVTPTAVSSNSANLQITTVVSNATAAAQTITVSAIITDADTNIVTELTNVVTLPAYSLTNVSANTVVNHPHLWNGLADPYLYQAFVEVYNGTTVTDLVSEPLGFRYYSVDPSNGFFLNGQHYDLHGVDMHQDWLNCGWALTNAQRASNFSFIKEIGATAMRLSHYEHHDYTYQLADQNGIILWSENPLIDNITASTAFSNNCQQQLIEMIKQRYNHPSIVTWSIYNEVTLDPGPNPDSLIAQLAQVVAQQDSTRPSTAAANTSTSDPSTFYTQLIDFNEYFGWYTGVVTDFGPWADGVHSTYPTRTVGVSEFGAGASIYQHSENPVTEPANAGPYHPEEYQNLFHESYWQQMKTRPFLWSKFVWNMFDFASDDRDEGDTPGRNDKGLVTYDRQVRKDAFYWYKANWTTNPMVYITGHTFTNRLTNIITGKVYANCDSVEFFLNGVSQGSTTSTNCIFDWPLFLEAGTNTAMAIGTSGGILVTDSLIWVAPTLPPTAAITSPGTSTVFIGGTNVTLSLSASAIDSQSNAPPPLTTIWTEISGPGSVVFGNDVALNTSATFNANGVYVLAFKASKGTNTTTENLTVVVGNVAYGPALNLRFPFDDTGTGTTTPSETVLSTEANVTLQMISGSGGTTNLHGAANSGVAGLTNPNRALNLSSNASQGATGNFVAATNSALAFGNVTSFTVTMWMKQSVGLPANIGPRMFILGNSTNTDCGTANSIGMKWQDAADLYFFVNTSQATASFGTNLPTNSWIFVAMTYDGTNATLYEGSDTAAATLVSTTAIAGQVVPLGSAASLFLCNRLGRDRDFAGWFDDFRFYTGAGDAPFVESVRQSAAGPSGLTGAQGNHFVTLNWTPLLGATSYNIKRASVSGGPYTTISTAGTVTGNSYTDATASNGTTYYYVVSAATDISEAAETANSAQEFSLTLGTPPPAPAATYNSPVYAGMTLYLTASTIAGAGYNWTGPLGYSATNQNPFIVNAQQGNSGVYSVTATVAGQTSTPGTTSVTVNPPVTLSVQPSGQGLIFSWPYGTLQWTTNLGGPWNNITGAAPPYTNVPAKSPAFYRLKLQ